MAHSASIWLTVALGIFRYITVNSNFPVNKVIHLRKAKMVIGVVYVVTFLLCLPNFTSITIFGHQKPNGIIWVLQFRSESSLDRVIHQVNFWIQAIVMKIMPGLTLFLFIFLLIYTLKTVESSRRRNIQNAHRGTTAQTSLVTSSEMRRIQEANRPTRLLIMILVLYFATEIPQGIMIILSGVLPNFLEQVYHPLGDVMDILSLANNNVTFILYCSTSKRFQNAMLDFFCCCFPPRNRSRHASLRKRRLSRKATL